MSGNDLEMGATVRWNTPQGETHGNIVERKTSDFTLAGQHFTATKDEPMFVVESATSGKRAAHKPSALTADKG